MFGAIKNITSNAKKLQPEKILHDALDNTQIQADIIALNTDGQLFQQGVFADGRPTGDYAINTIVGTAEYKGKIEKGQPYDHITFKDTGALYDSFRFNNGSDGFVITADTTKGGIDLEKRDGKIVGLTDESISVVREWVLPICIAKSRTALLKK